MPVYNASWRETRQSELRRQLTFARTGEERKALRVSFHNETERGWKERPCSACMGSGHYDNHGAPPCGACDGTGREKYNPVEVPDNGCPENEARR